MNLDDIVAVENFSDLTIQTLADRLQQTKTPEQCIYRESELDELWRLLDMAIRSDEPDPLRDKMQLKLMRELVHVAHDLVGMDGKAQEAARVLRQVLA